MRSTHASAFFFAPALLLALTLAPTGAAQAQNKTLRDFAQTTRRAVVAIDQRASARGDRDTNPLDRQALGCGFIISSEGHVVTHAGFVNKKGRVRLILDGGKRVYARYVASDTLNRTAILKLEKPAKVARLMGGTLPVLEWGDSRALQLGQTVFSITNTFNSLRDDGQASFSQGVVTTISRARRGGYLGVLIETDASVNPGSFGGPLLDSRGRVVGVIARNVSTRRWIGAAVPAAQVRLGVEKAIAGKPQTRGRLGVALESTGGEAAIRGLKVKTVLEGSGAAKAGLGAGDLLLSVGGVRVYDLHDVARELKTLSPGTSLPVRVVRDGRNRNLTIVLGEGEPLTTTVAEGPKPTTTPEPTEVTPEANERVSLGVRVEPRENGVGLVVVGVRDDSPAASAGVEEGDIVVSLGRTKIRSMEDLGSALAQYRPGQMARLIVLRDRRVSVLRVRFGAVAAKPDPTPAPKPTPETNERGYLGIYLADDDPQRPGAIVEGVAANSPADKAGLNSGDRIYRLNRKEIRSGRELVLALRNSRPGQVISVWLQDTQGKVAQRRVTLGTKGEVQPTEKPGPTRPAPNNPTPAGRPYLGISLESGVRGVSISEVDPNGPMARLGLAAGDIIQAVNGRPTTTVERFAEVIRSYKIGDRVRLDVERNGWTKVVKFNLTGRR